MECICVPVPVVHLDPNAIMEAPGMQLNNNLPTVAPPHTAAFLPWQLEECGGGNGGNGNGSGGNGNNPGDGPIFPPRDSDAMKFPYQDKKKEKRPTPPALSPAPIQRRESPSEGNSFRIAGDGKDRAGKRKHNEGGTIPTSTKTVVAAPRSRTIQSLNMLVVILISVLGLLVANKLF